MQKRKPSRKLLKKLPLNRLPPNRPLLNRLPLNRLPLNRLPLNRLLLNRLLLNRLLLNRLPLRRPSRIPVPLFTGRQTEKYITLLRTAQVYPVPKPSSADQSKKAENPAAVKTAIKPNLPRYSFEAGASAKINLSKNQPEISDLHRRT